MMKVIWICKTCNVLYNPGPNAIPAREYIMFDMSKNDFECVRCAARKNIIEP